MSSLGNRILGNAKDYIPIQADTVLTENDGDNEKIQLIRIRQQSLMSRLLTLAFLLLIVVVVVVSGLSVSQHTKEVQWLKLHNSMNPCGNSTSEALSLKCSFDHLMWSWYPEHCPHYTNGLFRRENFSYYESLKSTQPLDDDGIFRIVDRQGGVWVEKREHLTHCVYLLLAQGQIIRDATSYVPRLVEYGHLEHCVDAILETLRKDEGWYRRDSFVGEIHYDQTC